MTRARGVADYGYYPPVNNNILINPSFTVNQRGDVTDHMNSTATFGPDRWEIRGIGQVGGTMSQSTTVIDPTTGVNKLLVKHRNATSETYIITKVEAVDLQGMYEKEMTFSFSYSDTGGSGIPKVIIYTYNGSGGASIIYEAIPTSLGNDRWTCTFTLSTDDGTIPDPSEAGLQVRLIANEGNTAPAEWKVWETKLEVGSVATPFIARSYGEELLLCQRYYFMIADKRASSDKGNLIGTSFKYATSTETFTSLPVEMRATPTLETLFPGANTLRILMAGKNIDTNVLTIDSDATSSMLRLASSGINVADAPNGAGGWIRINEAGGYVAADAEL